MSRQSKRDEFTWFGEAMCLDFSNTQISRPTDAPYDRLKSYDHLIDWAKCAGLISNRQKNDLIRQAKQHPRVAARTLRRANVLRETIYRVFSSYAGERAPQLEDINGLNAALIDSLSHRKIVHTTPGFVWRWDDDSRNHDCILWPIVHSAAELLVSDNLAHVHECALETCSAMFLDSSKNKRRRWCDMKVCGNRAKSQRHYAKTRSAAG
jgi:predicted RNA-binding Zn ribbon-like protein